MPNTKEVEQMKALEKGDRILYTYKHTLNRKTFTWISKEGVFIKMLISDKCLVKLDKNKNNSKVPLANISIL